MKIKITSLDRMFSVYIRSRAKWKCEWPTCGKYYDPPTNGLHCAHVFSRRSKLTRWDEGNAMALCYGHHAWADSHPLEKYEVHIKTYGRENHQRVFIRSNMAGKVDTDMIAIRLRQLIKDLE